MNWNMQVFIQENLFENLSHFVMGPMSWFDFVIIDMDNIHFPYLDWIILFHQVIDKLLMIYSCMVCLAMLDQFASVLNLSGYNFTINHQRKYSTDVVWYHYFPLEYFLMIYTNRTSGGKMCGRIE